MARKPLVGQDLLFIEALIVTLRHTTLGRTPLNGWSVRHRELWQHTTFTRDWHLHPRWNSNPQSQQWNCCGPHLRPRRLTHCFLILYTDSPNITNCGLVKKLMDNSSSHNKIPDTAMRSVLIIWNRQYPVSIWNMTEVLFYKLHAKHMLPEYYTFTGIESCVFLIPYLRHQIS